MAPINKNKQNALSFGWVREMFRYDPDTGIMSWALAPSPWLSHMIGTRVGSIYKNSGGYRIVKIGYIPFKVSRLIWFYVNGVWPEAFVDHVNGDRDDDRLLNLREATCTQNNFNRSIKCTNKLGVKGVSYDPVRQKYCAFISKDRKNKNLGRFDSLEEAKRAYDSAASLAFGDFARAGESELHRRYVDIYREFNLDSLASAGSSSGPPNGGVMQ